MSLTRRSNTGGNIVSNNVERNYSSLKPLKKIIAHFEQGIKIEQHHQGMNQFVNQNPIVPKKPIVVKRRPSSKRNKPAQTLINRLSSVPEDEITVKHRPREASKHRPLDSVSFNSEPGGRSGRNEWETSSLRDVDLESDLDNISLASSSTMTSDMYDVTPQVGYGSLQRHYHHSNQQQQQQPVRHPRRHTLTGDEPKLNGNYSHLQSSSFAPSTGYPSDYDSPLHGVMSTSEAERKRSAFLRYLQQRYPQHADAIAGKAINQSYSQSTLPSSIHSNVRSRASYAAECYHANTALTSSSNDSGGFTYHHSLSRGGRLRSSLPIVRSRSRSRERPLGLIYLEFSGENRVAILPNELTSLDTIRALFVQAYPGLLTMPMLEAQRHSLLLKHKKTGTYEEIENVSRIKDRSVIRARPTGLSGIPLPGSKKPASPQSKGNSPNSNTTTGHYNKNNNSRQATEEISVVERNQKNQQKSGLKAPVKSQIRQCQPSAIKPPGSADKNGGRFMNGKNNDGGKVPRGKAPSPPPRSAKPTVLESSDNLTASPNGTLSGNGLGGGSIPQKGFSYIRSGSESNDAPVLQDDGLPPPPPVVAMPTADEKKTIRSPQVLPKPSNPARPKTPTYDQHTRIAASKPRTSGVKSPSQISRLPSKRDPALSDATNQPMAQSITKRASSPERRATINGTGGSAGYCRGGRSFRGQQLKPFSIPQVPDVNDVTRNNGNKPEVTSKPAVAPKPSPKRETVRSSSDNETLEPSVTSSTDEISDETKVKSKKGLFGFKRLVGSRSSGRSSAKVRSQSEERRTPSQAPTPAVPAQHKLSPLSTRKPALPKTDLLSTLLSNNARQAGDVTRRFDAAGKPPDVESTTSSVQSEDDSREQVSRSNHAPALTGVLKNGSLVKSTSSSSILSDSACSNLSNTPSLKTKKVSFQDDVTVCDANGISTYSNGLRHSDVSTTFEQSLSCDANDRDVSEVRPWRDRPSTPFDEKPAFSPRPSTYQSAVAAAIQSISASTPVLSTNDRAHQGHVQRYEQFSSPVSKQERHEIPHKEEWSPLRRPVVADVARGGTEIVAPPTCPTPMPAMTSKEAVMSDVTHDSGPSYFQTGRMTSSHVSGDSFNPDTPPYYECCESSAPLARPITPNELRSALTQERHPMGELDGDQSQGGSNEHAALLPNVTSLPLSNPTGSDSLPSEPPQRPASDDTTKKRVILMERQLASLTGMVESIITSTDHRSPVPFQDDAAPQVDDIGEKQPPLIGAITQEEMKNQLLKLRDTAHGLKQQLVDLKRIQRANMEHMQELVNEKTRDLAQFISTTAGAAHRPLRARRLRLDQDRQSYGMTATKTEKQLSDVEAAVEELRNEVVERRCRVNAREVEALVLQLSQAGRTIAQLKGLFPNLCEELRHVAAAESEVIYAEEKFNEAEPTRLDEQLKRCKQLTATLFTLKKLATVQEARSKTPVPQLRPTTPNPLMNRNPGYDDPTMQHARVFDDVRRVRVDNARRMESIKDAEISWNRRRKFIREYDAKKFEKSLEIAERALNRTDYISQNEQRRHKTLLDLYKHRDVTETKQESNLTNSDSSSLESLPPPPPPVEATYPHNAPKPAPNPTSVLPPPPSNLALPNSAPGGDNYVVISPDGGYTSSDPSPDQRRPNSHVGSLPRYVDPSQRSQRGYAGPGQPLGRSHSNYARVQDGYGGQQGGRHTPLHMVERSRSVTPQHWAARPTTPRHFMNEVVQSAYDTSDDERHRYMEQQHQSAQAEKSQRLKEQYSKLQMLQRKQRMVEKKHVPNPKHKTSSIPSYQVTNMQAKSSDV